MAFFIALGLVVGAYSAGYAKAENYYNTLYTVANTKVVYGYPSYDIPISKGDFVVMIDSKGHFFNAFFADRDLTLSVAKR